MDLLIREQLKKIEQKEKKICLAKKKPEGEITQKIQEKIPAGLEKKLEQAFYMGFKTVFTKGSKVIEKTYNKEKRKEDFEIQEFILNKRKTKKALRDFQLKSDKQIMSNIGITAIEGTTLGFFGIGLPDIPVFIGMLFKSLYEIAMSYGFSYESEEEKYYILLLIEGAFLEEEKKKKQMEKIDRAAGMLSRNVVEKIDLDQQMKRTAQALSKEMLYAKFLQGIPLAGIVGGLSNIKCMKQVTVFARLKYQKRYFLGKANEEQGRD